MINKVLRGALVLCCISTGLAFAKETPQAFFTRLRVETLNKLPVRFKASLTGITIENKLKTIPRNSYTDPARKPVVVLSYDRAQSLDLKVENVDELYQDLFAQYVRLFTLGPILSSMDNAALLERYDFSLEYTSTGLIQLRIRLKEAENSFLAYVNPADMSILRMDYFVGSQILTSTLIKYVAKTRNGKKYSIPSTFVVKTFNQASDRPDSFKLEDIRIP